jgi:hypothetical protein
MRLKLDSMVAITSALKRPHNLRALVYSGTLTDSAGAALSTPQNVGVAVFDAATAGNRLCEPPSQATDLDPAGTFR